MLTRRQLLALLPAAALPLEAQVRLFRRKPKPKPAPMPFVYIGTDTSRPAARGIYLSRFDVATGHFTDPVLAAACVRPSYFAVNRKRSGAQSRMFLYSVNAGTGADAGVTSYQMNPATGALSQIGQVSSGGDGPCYIGLDAEGHSAYVADYNGGSIATYLIQADGSLSAPVDRVDFHGPRFGHHGPVAARQDGPHPHTTMLSPDNRFLIVNDLGNDDIVTFPVNTMTAKLGTPHVMDSRLAGTGPRHLAFHPNERWVYGIDELANRIDEYLWNSTRGSTIAEPQAVLTDTGRSVSTLDPGFHGTSTAAEIVVAPSGGFVYGSNRGENSLVVFSVDALNGNLTFVQRISCGGKTPRHFTLDASGKWLVCGNQESASVTVFKVDTGSGKLSGPTQTLQIDSPMFTLFA
jgi:6-phosphogluconolactonase